MDFLVKDFSLAWVKHNRILKTFKKSEKYEFVSYLLVSYDTYSVLRIVHVNLVSGNHGVNVKMQLQNLVKGLMREKIVKLKIVWKIVGVVSTLAPIS